MANGIETCETLPALPSPVVQDASTRPYYPMGDYEGYSLAVCALPSPSLRERIQEVSEKLQKNFPEHSYTPDNYLHMSIARLGIVATTQEVERTRIAIEPDLLAMTATMRPVRVLVEGINNFDSCFFAEVFNNDFFDEEDPLAQLHTQIAKIAKNVMQQPYIPHLTMGYPSSRDHKLYAHIHEHYANWRFGKDIIDTLSLTALDTKLSLEQQPLKILAEYPLGG